MTSSAILPPPEPAAGLGHDNIALLGISRGTEAAFLTAANFPGLARAVVAVAPGHLSTPGFHPQRGLDVSTWSMNGSPVPFVPFPPIDLAQLRVAHASPENPLRQAEWYEQMYNRAGLDPMAIPVERMQAPVLMISGTADAVWPSRHSGDEIVRRLRANNYAYPVRHLVIEGAGHGLWMSPSTVTSYSHLGFHRLAQAFTTSGGTPDRNAEASRAAFEATDRFLRRRLR